MTPSDGFLYRIQHPTYCHCLTSLCCLLHCPLPCTYFAVSQLRASVGFEKYRRVNHLGINSFLFQIIPKPHSRVHSLPLQTTSNTSPSFIDRLIVILRIWLHETPSVIPLSLSHTKSIHTHTSNTIFSTQSNITDFPKLIK